MSGDHRQHHTPITAEEIAHVFEEEEAPVDLSPYSVEDWVTLAVFWGMALCVFLQFFTRYVLNNSLAWTEEIAINCLVVVVFLGSVWCVRTLAPHPGRHALPLPAARRRARALHLRRPRPHRLLRLCVLAALALRRHRRRTSAW